jgi:hypothetical protein
MLSALFLLFHHLITHTGHAVFDSDLKNLDWVTTSNHSIYCIKVYSRLLLRLSSAKEHDARQSGGDRPDIS